MSDDRLFASNNAIGRQGYVTNIIILAIIVLATKFTFDNYILPNVKTDAYYDISNGIALIIYVIYLITFFSLVDRRLYDATGSRGKTSYKVVSQFLFLTVVYQALIIAVNIFSIDIPVSTEALQSVAWIFDFIFLTAVFALSFFKGQITNLTYEEYRRKVKYEE